MVVTLDPKENHCACGGIGHLEGIMGSRAIRLRFLDREPEEVFRRAFQGDAECHNFVLLWHRALAAASASCIHLDGPGEFFITGPNSPFVDTRLLDVYTDSMVRMSPWQGSSFKIIETGEEIGVLGAAVDASLTLDAKRQETLSFRAADRKVS
jgi:predicted NBD/HSP70 family sugar kinase